MGMFGSIAYPLKAQTSVNTFSDSIMKSYTWETLSNELKDSSKKSWSDKASDIAKTFAYTVADGSAPSAAYIAEGKEIIRKQIALAAYWIVDQIIYCMQAQKPRNKWVNS